jgi:N-acylneuraminate cytidylyltransferase
MQKDTLFLIPARGGSKGIPKKNIKELGGKPLIQYTLEVAQEVAGEDDTICVSSDDDEIIQVVEHLGFQVPFKRPAELASDTAGSYEVLLHAINFYEDQGTQFNKLVLLQPTSPFRNAWQVKEAMALFTNDLDMVVSVKASDANPYVNLFEENEQGFLEKSKKGKYLRRQDARVVYQYNGAIYVMNIDSLKKQSDKEFEAIKKYVMDEKTSLDIDHQLDWEFAEFLS